jgi:hypothetical protein
VGNLWSMELTITSTCPNDVTIALYGGGGSMNLVVPALAESALVAGSDRLAAVPTYWVVRSPCSTAGATLTVEAVQLAPGHCIEPATPVPSPLPWPSPTLAPSLAPSMEPTRYVGPCGSDYWPSTVDLPYSFHADANGVGATVFSSSQLADLHARPEWQFGHVWTLQVTVSSTCASDMTFALEPDAGSGTTSALSFVVPALSESNIITLSNSLGDVPARFAVTASCPEAAVVTFSSVSMYASSCDPDSPLSSPLPTLKPTVMPSLQPTAAVAVHFPPSPGPTVEPSLAPSVSPSSSYRPTRQPSPEPTQFTHSPTFAPTLMNCSRLSDGTLDPSPYLQHLKPEIQAS